MAKGKAAKQQQMPMCSYGAACNRKGCIYRHPPAPPKPAANNNGGGAATAASTARASPSEPEEVCKPFLAGKCHYGNRCYNYHPPEKEADAMRRKYCWWSVSVSVLIGRESRIANRPTSTASPSGPSMTLPTKERHRMPPR